MSSVGIFKPGQGYWTRVLTAVGIGVLFLTGAFFLYSEVGALPVPTPRWEMSFTATAGQPAPGQTLTLFVDPEMTQRAGSATVEAVDAAARTLTIGSLDMTAGVSPGGVSHVRSVDEAFDASVSNQAGIPSFQIAYLQAAAAIVVMVFGAAATYWLSAVNHKSIEFMIAVDTEMRKVNWSTRREVMGSTWVVIATCVVITAFLYGVDYVFGNFFRWIDVINV